MYLQYVGSCTDTGICIIAVLLRVLVEHVCRSFRVYLYIIRDTLNPTLSISNNKSKKVTTCCPVSQVLQKKKNHPTPFSEVHAVTVRSTTVTVCGLRTCDDTTVRHRETFSGQWLRVFKLCLPGFLFCFVFYWIFLILSKCVKKNISFQRDSKHSDLGLIQEVWSDERNNVDRYNRAILVMSIFKSSCQL